MDKCNCCKEVNNLVEVYAVKLCTSCLNQLNRAKEIASIVIERANEEQKKYGDILQDELSKLVGGVKIG